MAFAALVLVSSVALTGCAPEPVDEHIVIDGWIEDGGYPIVILTSSLSVEEGAVWSQDNLRKHVLTTATVTVSDGENSVVLMGKKDDRYFPPYIYTTSWLKGEAGKTYSLHVKYGRTEATAVTTIPAPQPLLGITSVPEGDGYNVYCRFAAQPGSYYTFFSMRVGKDKTYLPSFLTQIDGSTVSGESNTLVMKGYDITSSEKHENLYAAEDQVSIRFCTIDRATYDFWKGYEESWLFSHNPFFPVTSGVPSNITGGYGLWAGYGATYATAPGL